MLHIILSKERLRHPKHTSQPCWRLTGVCMYDSPNTGIFQQDLAGYALELAGSSTVGHRAHKDITSEP